MTTTARTDFLLAAAMFADFCEQIDDDQWDQPALGEWDVRALVGHTLRAVTTVAAYLSQRPPEGVSCRSAGEYFALVRTLPGADDRAVAERGHEGGRQLGDDPVGAIRSAVDGARAALAAVGEEELVVMTVVGGMRLADYLPTRTFELLAHTLDLSAATGLDLQPPAAVVESSLQTAVDAAALTSDGVALFRHLLGRPGGAHRPLFG